MAVEQTGLVHWHRGEYDQARRAFDGALAAARDVDYVRGVIHASNDLAGLHYELGEYTLAFARVQEGLAAAEQIGYRPAVGWMTGNAGELFRHLGDYDQAVACYGAALMLMIELRDWRVLLINLGNYGVALAALDRSREAALLLEEAVDLARKIRNPYHLCEYAHQLAALLDREGRFTEARPLNDEALALSSEIERRDVRFLATVLAVRLRRALGEIELAEARAELALMVDDWPGKREQAALEFERWCLDPRDEKARKRAAELYVKLHAAAPDVAYIERFEALTGKRLADPPRLPPLVEDPKEPEVGTLLVELSMLKRELELADEVVAP
jgi:tetratricopeptide (TPR) repeat protein